MRFDFIDAEKARYPVELLCELLQVSRSGFYAWRRRAGAPKRRRDGQLAAQIASVHRGSRGTYGSPRVHAELRANGVRVSRKRVERLMREQGLRARQKRRFRRTTDSRHTLAVAPNVLERRFDVTSPNQVWVTDVTALWTLQGWLYLAAILDLFSRRVVGWATSESNDRALALRALHAAVRARRPAPGLVHHSDRGSPYASEDYRRALATAAISASMSRAGDCWDNAVAESFFATLKTELVHDEVFRTRDQATAAIGDYIEQFYNPRRRHSHLRYKSPIEFELKRQVAAMAA